MTILEYISAIHDFRLIVSSVAISISLIILAIVYRTLKEKKEAPAVVKVQREELPPPPEEEFETPAEQPRPEPPAKNATHSRAYSKEIKKLKDIQKRLLHR